jgi:hypothetical protein
MYIVKDEVKKKLSKMGNMYVPGSNLDLLEGYINELYNSSYNNDSTNDKLDVVISELETYCSDNNLHNQDFYRYYIFLLKELDKMATHYYSDTTLGNKLSFEEEQNLYYELLNNIYLIVMKKKDNKNLNHYFEGVSYKRDHIYGYIQIMFWKIETNNRDSTYRKYQDRVLKETNLKFDTTYKCETYLNQVDLTNIRIFNQNITNESKNIK